MRIYNQEKKRLKVAESELSLTSAMAQATGVKQRVCRRRNMAAEDDAQQSAAPVSWKKAPRRAGVPRNC
jgi:hypothetical protein